MFNTLILFQSYLYKAYDSSSGNRETLELVINFEVFCVEVSHRLTFKMLSEHSDARCCNERALDKISHFLLQRTGPLFGLTTRLT